MKRATVWIVGTDPLMMNPMSAETLEGIRKKKPKQAVRDRAKELEAAENLYKDDEDNLIIPVDNLYASLVAAGTKIKNGKFQISAANKTSLYSIMTIVSERLVLVTSPDDPTPPKWVVDQRRGVGKQAATPTAVCITRPRFDEWAFQVDIDYDDGTYHMSLVLNLFREAGANQGLCSFRPNQGRGRFGRFKVAKFHEVDIPDVDQTIEILSNGKPVDAAKLVAPSPTKAKGKKGAGKNRLVEHLAEGNGELADVSVGGNGEAGEHDSSPEDDDSSVE